MRKLKQSGKSPEIFVFINSFQGEGGCRYDEKQAKHQDAFV